MSSQRKSKRYDRRRNQRRSKSVSALVGPKKKAAQVCENAVIEEVGSNGMRIVSGAAIKEEDSLVVYVGDQQKPVGAKVVWVEKKGLIEKRQSGKAGQAYVAGVRLKTARAPKPKKKEPKRKFKALKQSRAGELPVHLMRGLVVAAGLGFVALIIYALVTLGEMMG